VFGQGTQYVQENLNKYVTNSRIKYYFAVDNAYVGKKLMLLLFPYANKNWSLKYSSDEPAQVPQQQQQPQQSVPVAPRFDVNAPDLYIPVMAFVTYILLCGVALGIGNKFTPEQLGVLTSTALVMIAIVLSGLLFSSLGFYIALLWFGAALAFFLIRTLNFQIQAADQSSEGHKRRLYMLLFIAGLQPLFMWLLTARVLS
uniref:Protein YIF1 n=1 Tax=Macrostomum lignano TaxID=282301 RepID=A0A1I8FZK0_9PLAT